MEVSSVKIFLKKCAEPIFVTFLKLFGCSWLGYFPGIILLFALRAMGATADTQWLWAGLVGTAFTIIFLFCFMVGEGGENIYRKASRKERLILSVAPPLIWLILCCLLKVHCEMLIVCPGMIIMGWQKIHVVDYTFFTPLPIGSVCALLYALAIYSGSLMGRRIHKY